MSSLFLGPDEEVDVVTGLVVSTVVTRSSICEVMVLSSLVVAGEYFVSVPEKNKKAQWNSRLNI